MTYFPCLQGGYARAENMVRPDVVHRPPPSTEALRKEFEATRNFDKTAFNLDNAPSG